VVPGMKRFALWAALLLVACRRTLPAADSGRPAVERAPVAPLPIPAGLNGFGLAYLPGIPMPNQCIALYRALAATHSVNNRCVVDADCVSFGSCDTLNRNADPKKLVALERDIERIGCPVSWGDCMRVDLVCSQDHCARRGSE
jgi:hypothetical protein